MGVMKAIAQLIDENREYLVSERHNEHYDGYRFKFPNSFGVDLVTQPGHDKGRLYEIALFGFGNENDTEGCILYTDCVSRDVLQYLSADEVSIMMNQIKEGRIYDKPDIYKEERNGNN